MFGILRTIMKIKLSDPITEKQKRMARFAKAMGHPIRLYVLELLSKQSCCYSGDLTEELPIAKSTLSQHLKELKFSFLTLIGLETCLWNLLQMI